jgi:general secretion pathway protein K
MIARISRQAMPLGGKCGIGGAGFAQLVVLWALLLLGMLAMSFSFAMRTEALAARNGVDAARAYYQARTGIHRAISLLSESAVDNVMREPLAGEEEDASYRTRVTSEGGKVDINHVPEALLKEILGNAGLSAEEAEIAGDSILDWRDPDDMPRPYGAEDAFYSSLPTPLKIRNGRISALDELLSVRGVTPELYARLLSRAFTVFGQSSSVDINAAPAEVLRILPGFSPQAAEAVVERRKENPFRSPAEVAAFLSDAGVPPATAAILSTSSQRRVFTITSVGKAGGKISRVVECRVEIAGSGEKSVKILRWTDYVALADGA